MKKITVRTLFIGLFAVLAAPSYAYCVHNQSDKYIVAFQLPITSQSFKKAISPGKHACCNWSNFSCNTQVYLGNGNRFGFTPLVVGSYSSRSKADKKKNDIQFGAVFQDILKTGVIALGAYKGCVKCAKKAILVVEDISQEVFKSAYTCSGLMQNGAGVAVRNGEKCYSYDLEPNGFYAFATPKRKSGKNVMIKRGLSSEPPEYKYKNIPWPKINGDSFAWLPWIR